MNIREREIEANSFLSKVAFTDVSEGSFVPFTLHGLFPFIQWKRAIGTVYSRRKTNKL